MARLTGPDQSVPRPNITPAQLGLVASSALNVLVSFGLHITTTQQHAIDQLTQSLLVVVGADAIIRVGRNLAKR